MLSRLNLLESHLTSLPPSENLLDKYRKMSTLDEKFLDEIYYLGNKDTVELFDMPMKLDKTFT